MKKPLVAFLVACGLAAGCLGGAAASGPVLDNALSRYPGSVRSADEAFDFNGLREGRIARQAVFVSEDDFATVKGWYAERLDFSPASTMNVSSGGCILMTQSDAIYRFEHTIAVVICGQGEATRVIFNEKLVVWP